MSFADNMKTIVVATDLTGQSKPAVDYARKLAAAYGARVVLAHGLDPVEYAAVGTLPAGVRHSMSEQARKALERLSCELMTGGIPSHSEFRQAAVVQMLLDVVRQYRAGMLVIGTRGMQGAGPIVAGTIAEELVRLAPCPVLAVAADWNAGEFRPTPGGPVMLALERNEATQAAIATAQSLAEAFHRKLVVVHARGSATASASLNPAAAAMQDFGFDAGALTSMRCIVKDGNPPDAIARAIQQYRPCVLVAGVKRISATSGPHGTAFGLLARSRVPVLCVPPGAAQFRAQAKIQHELRRKVHS